MEFFFSLSRNGDMTYNSIIYGQEDSHVFKANLDYTMSFETTQASEWDHKKKKKQRYFWGLSCPKFSKEWILVVVAMVIFIKLSIWIEIHHL